MKHLIALIISLTVMSCGQAKSLPVYYVNWDCSSYPSTDQQAGCAKVMTAMSGTQGPFNGVGDCKVWADNTGAELYMSTLAPSIDLNCQSN